MSVPSDLVWNVQVFEMFCPRGSHFSVRNDSCHPVLLLTQYLQTLQATAALSPADCFVHRAPGVALHICWPTCEHDCQYVLLQSEFTSSLQISCQYRRKRTRRHPASLRHTTESTFLPSIFHMLRVKPVLHSVFTAKRKKGGHKFPAAAVMVTA